MLPLLFTIALASHPAPGIAPPAPDTQATRILVFVRDTEALSGSVALVTREVERIWRSPRILFEWTTELAARSDADVIVTVHLSDKLPPGVSIPSTALGAVPIVDGRFQPVVYVSPKAVQRLVLAAGVPTSSGPFRHLYARTLARVIAHELGHLLLQSRAHRATGLMRAAFVPRDVLSSDMSRYDISADDVNSVQARLVTQQGATLISRALPSTVRIPPPR